MAEQFVADLKMLFPGLRVMAVESNRLLNLAEPLGRSVYFSGNLVQDGLSKESLSTSCCLLISQSGQTYPSLHAVRVLAPILGQSLWLLVGTECTQMEMTLRKAYQRAGWVYGDNRVMLNTGGYRPAEPTSLAIVAAYHTLSALLLRLLQRAVDPSISSPSPSSSSSSSVPPSLICVMHPHGVRELHSMVATILVEDMVEITGSSDAGDPVKSPVHQSIVEQGKLLGGHVREAWTVLLGVAFYICASVVLGVPLFFLLFNIVCMACGYGPFDHFSLLSPGMWRHRTSPLLALLLLINVLDALVYIYMAKLLAWALRLAQGRALGARMGKRALVIVDYPCIHQVGCTRLSSAYAWISSLCNRSLPDDSSLRPLRPSCSP